jgi:hypothetical protein
VGFGVGSGGASVLTAGGVGSGSDVVLGDDDAHENKVKITATTAVRPNTLRYPDMNPSF